MITATTMTTASCLALAAPPPATYRFPSAIEMCVFDSFAVVGLFAGHLLAFAVGWRWRAERAAEESGTDSRTLSDDVTFRVLKNRRRRQALQCLRRAGGESCLSDLAEHVAAMENGVAVRELTSAQRKRAYVTLYQYHLPTMDEAGVVEYDRDRGDVELLDAASELFEYLGEPDRADAPESNAAERCNP